MKKNQKNLSYHENIDIQNTLKLREILNSLPRFAKDYFRAIEHTTSTKTRISYAYDLRIFFRFLKQTLPQLKSLDISAFPIDLLEQITTVDLEEYQEYLKVYQDDTNQIIMNKERGIKRKLSSLRSFYTYYYKHEFITSNPTQLIDMPKLHDKQIIRLDTEEIRTLLDAVEYGNGPMTPQELNYHQKYYLRDLAIMTLLLGTGLRVSECVGIDIDDIYFKENGIKVYRKGGNEMVVYFGDEVAIALLNYLEEREQIKAVSGHENALFLSSRRTRMGIKTVENMVKKYSQKVIPGKKITPHKLRSTYGTHLYKSTGDIYLVADVLGHKDVNTTRKHYAAMEEENRKRAGQSVTLRDMIE